MSRHRFTHTFLVLSNIIIFLQLVTACIFTNIGQWKNPVGRKVFSFESYENLETIRGWITNGQWYFCEYGNERRKKRDNTFRYRDDASRT